VAPLFLFVFLLDLHLLECRTVEFSWKGSTTMYELQVEGMSCNHCVNAVTKSVQAVDPAAKVDVDLAQQKVRVNSNAGIDQIAAAVDDAGYPVLSRTSTPNLD
jgi:copper ion binding protein